jgi:hypothetical protein
MNSWRRAAFVLLILGIATTASAAEPSDLTVNVQGVGAISAPLQLVLVMTLLSFIPAALVVMTSFTRIVIVFHFLRQALGTQEMPSNQILIGLSLFLTVFVMAPVAERVNTLAVAPVLDGRMSVTDALSAGSPPLRDFMLKQTREKIWPCSSISGSCNARRARGSADAGRDSGLRHLRAEDRISDGVLPVRAVPPDRPRRVHDAAVDGHAAAAARNDFAPVQGAAVRHGRWLESARVVARA